MESRRIGHNTFLRQKHTGRTIPRTVSSPMSKNVYELAPRAANTLADAECMTLLQEGCGSSSQGVAGVCEDAP